jgi:hypothetical protein
MVLHLHTRTILVLKVTVRRARRMRHWMEAIRDTVHIGKRHMRGALHGKRFSIDSI